MTVTYRNLQNSQHWRHSEFSFTPRDELGIINFAQMITNNKIKHQRSSAGQMNIKPTRELGVQG